MLGYGENYILFFPSHTIVFRFLDEFDLDFTELALMTEALRSSCHQ